VPQVRNYVKGKDHAKFPSARGARIPYKQGTRLSPAAVALDGRFIVRVQDQLRPISKLR
jgi:hypothetical protein